MSVSGPVENLRCYFSGTTHFFDFVDLFLAWNSLSRLGWLVYSFSLVLGFQVHATVS